MTEISYLVERDLDRCGGAGVIMFELRNGALCILVLEKDPGSPEWAGGFGPVLPETCRLLAQDLRNWVRRPSHTFNHRKAFWAEIEVQTRWDAWRPNEDSPAQMSAESEKSTISLRVETERNALGLADLFREMHERLQRSSHGR